MPKLVAKNAAGRIGKPKTTRLGQSPGLVAERLGGTSCGDTGRSVAPAELPAEFMRHRTPVEANVVTTDHVGYRRLEALAVELVPPYVEPRPSPAAPGAKPAPKAEGLAAKKQKPARRSGNIEKEASKVDT